MRLIIKQKPLEKALSHANWIVAHFDSATAKLGSKNMALSQKGATGFGVGLACAFIAAQCAKAQNEEFVK
jgi:leucyl aminopeptidase